MAEKKRMAFDPLNERKPKGMDGLIRDTRNLSELDEKSPKESVDNAKALSSETNPQPSGGYKAFGNVVKVVRSNSVDETTGGTALSAESAAETSDIMQDARSALIAHDTHDTHIAKPAHILTAPSTSDPNVKKQPNPRINLVIDEDSDDYLKTMAGIKKISVTKYINQLIDADKKAKWERYLTIKELSEQE